MDFLPNVKKCCFCVPLFIGSVLIGVFGILLGAGNGTVYDDNTLAQLSVGLGVVFLVASILLLIGLFLKIRLLVAIWIYVAGVLVILAIIALVVSLINHKKEASQHVSYVGFIIAYLFVFYFMIVVNSHWRTMRKDNTIEIPK